MNWRSRMEPLVRPMIQRWWRLSRGTTLGVRGIVEDADRRVVLVHHTYVDGWHLPGGGVEAGETALEALERELAEEAGIQVTGPVEPMGLFANHAVFRGDHVMVYRVDSWTRCATDSAGEIAEIGWFAIDDLPATTTPGTRRRLAEWAGQTVCGRAW